MSDMIFDPVPSTYFRPPPVDNWRPLNCEQNLRVSYWELLCFCRICLDNVEMRVANMCGKSEDNLIHFFFCCPLYNELRPDAATLNLMMKTGCEQLRNYILKANKLNI